MAYKDTFNGNRQKLLDALKAAGMLGLDSREVAALGLGAAHSRMAELDEFHIIQRKDSTGGLESAQTNSARTSCGSAAGRRWTGRGGRFGRRIRFSLTCRSRNVWRCSSFPLHLRWQALSVWGAGW